MKSLLLALFLFSILLLPAPSRAHITLYDHDIGVLLHINPNDDPIALEAADLHFNLLSEKYDPLAADCLCTASISLNGVSLIEKKILEAESEFGPKVLSLPFIFPKKGVYQIVFEGQSKTNQFPNFSLIYDVRIEKISEVALKNQKQNFYLWSGAAVVFILAFALALKKGLGTIKVPRV